MTRLLCIACIYSQLPGICAQNIAIEPYRAKATAQYHQFSQIPVQKILDVIDARDIVVYQAPDQKIWLAQLKAGQWETFTLLEDFTTETSLSIIDQQQIDGTGNDEIIVKWEYMGKRDFLNVILKGIQIWNTDSAICYLDEYTATLEERYLRESDLQYYAGCERNITVKGKKLNITPFRCDYDLGIEILPEKIYTGSFYFSDGKYKQKETGARD
jgi:hypothetical protein